MQIIKHQRKCSSKTIKSNAGTKPTVKSFRLALAIRRQFSRQGRVPALHPHTSTADFSEEMPIGPDNWKSTFGIAVADANLAHFLPNGPPSVPDPIFRTSSPFLLITSTTYLRRIINCNIQSYVTYANDITYHKIENNDEHECVYVIYCSTAIRFRFLGYNSVTRARWFVHYLCPRNKEIIQN